MRVYRQSSVWTHYLGVVSDVFHWRMTRPTWWSMKLWPWIWTAIHSVSPYTTGSSTCSTYQMLPSEGTEESTSSDFMKRCELRSLKSRPTVKLWKLCERS
jgi:hypothetical protein